MAIPAQGEKLNPKDPEQAEMILWQAVGQVPLDMNTNGIVREAHNTLRTMFAVVEKQKAALESSQKKETAAHAGLSDEELDQKLDEQLNADAEETPDHVAD